jgi:hypothetical protein
MFDLDRTLVLGAALLASVTWSASASADDEIPVAATPPPVVEPVAVTPKANPLGLKPLDGAALARKRGGTEVLNDMKLRGVVAENSATNVVTGGNVISEGALAGAAGLPTVIQNSGNNVLIQNATIVNVQMK